MNFSLIEYHFSFVLLSIHKNEINNTSPKEENQKSSLYTYANKI